MFVNNFMIPPTIKFQIPYLWNPRTQKATDAFGLAVFSYDDEEIYTWNTTFNVTLNGKLSTDVTSGPRI